jgi:DNA-binding XRE family transcriptional regulator
MAAHDDTARNLLGHLLRLAREQSQYQTQNDVAHAVGVERSAITRAEAGSVTAHVLGDILTRCGVTGIARVAVEGVHRLARQVDEIAAVQAAPWFETEARAHTLRFWNPTIVPGLFQTAAYARELFSAMRLSADTVSEYMEVRMGRQAIFSRTMPPDITCIVWEPVLYHPVGPAGVMAEQLEHLLTLSQMGTVSVHVFPSSLMANAGLGGPINLAATDDAPELLASDGLVEDKMSQDPAVVHAARTTFSSVRGDSLSRAESRTRIREAVTTWTSK